MTKDPIAKVTSFTLADEIRLARKRTPSDFKTILNYSNTLSDGLRVRRGYASYDGIVWPVVNGDSLTETDLAVPMLVQTERPEKKDVFLLGMNSDPQMWMFPYWRNSDTAIEESMPLAEKMAEGKSPTFYQLFFAPDVSFPTAHSMKIVSWTNRYSLITANDYFNGWALCNATQTTSTIITDSAYSSGDDSMTFTVSDDISVAGDNWSAASRYEIHRNYHDSIEFSGGLISSFIPTFKVALSDPPCAISDNSLIYFSGGQGADENLRGSIIYPRMNKTFFSWMTETFSMNTTYVCQEECKAYDILSTLGLGVMATGVTALEELKTYWIGIAPIYDDGTIGELQRYEDTSIYDSVSDWDENYLGAATTLTLTPTVTIRSGVLNKTVQGFKIYLAQDAGDTRVSGRQTAYFSVGKISLTSENQNVDISLTGNWAYTAPIYSLQFQITGDMWDARGNTYETDSGMAEAQSDISYAYSGRKVVGGRHYLYNVYVASESQADKQNLFTNPIGQDASVNAGIVAKRVFPNEQVYYRIECKPEVGSRINAVIPTGFTEMLVLKNLGVVSVRVVETQDLLPQHIDRIVDHKTGCSTFHGYSISNQEEIYFAGYDDCYLYKLGQLVPLIEREDKRDWLHTYREVLTNTQKENVVVIWLPQNYLIWDFGQTAGNQYILDRGGWTQAAFNQSVDLDSTEFFKFPVKLNNGTVLALGTPGNRGLRQFQNPTTGAFYYTDAGIAIKTQLDTDYFNFGHDNDMVFSKIVFNRMFDATPSGILSATLYRDRVAVRTHNLGISRYRTYMHSVIGDPKIGFEWRFIYNNNSSPEVMAGEQLQIDSIEIYGELRSRSKRAGEVVTVTNVGIWDEDTWDGGKSYG